MQDDPQLLAQLQLKILLGIACRLPFHQKKEPITP